MDDFTLMSILDVLPLNDLVKIASLNPRFSQLIAKHYMNSLQDREIYITLDDAISIRASSVDAPFPIIIDEYETVLSALQHFGHIFRYLDIRIRPTGYKYLDKIQSFVNKYCSDALQKVTIIRDDNDPTPFEFSFVNTTCVFVVDTDRNRADPLPLHTAFPQMEKLATDANLDLNHHYPHLSEIFVSRVLDLSDMWRLNPQLRRIEIQLSSDPAYFRKLTEWVPNLESLTLMVLKREYNFYTSPLAQFKNLKNFTLSMDPLGELFFSFDRLHVIFDSIRFDKLESFTLISSRYIALDSVIPMITQNAALQIVNLNVELSFAQFSEVITNLPELKELTICWHRIKTRPILNRMLEHIIATNHGLNKITIDLVQRPDVTTKADFLEFLPVGWTNEENAQPTLLQLVRSE